LLLLFLPRERMTTDTAGGTSLEVTHHRPMMSMETAEASPPQIRGRTS
jgi:hypothetical protein